MADLQVFQRAQPGRCAYCKDAVELSQRAACAACLAVHHEGCWSEHGRCAACGVEEVLRRATPSSGAWAPSGGEEEEEAAPERWDGRRWKRVGAMLHEEEEGLFRLLWSAMLGRQTGCVPVVTLFVVGYLVLGALLSALLEFLRF